MLSCNDRYKSVNESAFVNAGWLISAFFPQLNSNIPAQEKRIPEMRLLIGLRIAHEYGASIKMLSGFSPICFLMYVWF